MIGYDNDMMYDNFNLVLLVLLMSGCVNTLATTLINTKDPTINTTCSYIMLYSIWMLFIRQIKLLNIQSIDPSPYSRNT